ncbi:ABC transporter permease [Solihabitans fulvus]|uniref:ABC transporter permease n=1 Tax=Solihabitans fulvus TaxID=1892852 RepID=A0A5B2WQR7_9PSEU|nr:ABC transporter permease [Solihabitans fulvus]KAA2252866.1 ABC transporter permease [Solihabitans fulvus]
MFIALRDLRFARGRFALMGAVVALITLLVVLLAGLTSGLARESVSGVRDLPATTAFAFGTPAAGQQLNVADSRVDADQVRRWAGQHGVAEANPLGIAPARLRIGGQEVAVTAFGAEPGSGIAPPSLADGRIVASTALTDKYRDGRAELGGLSYSVTPAATAVSFSHTPVVWLPLADWRKLDAARGGYASVIALNADSGADLAAGDAAARTVTKSGSAALSAVGSYQAENGSLTLIQVLLFAVSALVIGAFFTVWTVQRAPDLAVLKAIGASNGYLVRDALTQAIVVLLAGGIAGAGVATGLGVLAAQAVPFQVDVTTTLVPLALMVAVGVLGAAIAVRRITSVDAINALGAAR